MHICCFVSKHDLAVEANEAVALEDFCVRFFPLLKKGYARICPMKNSVRNIVKGVNLQFQGFDCSNFSFPNQFELELPKTATIFPVLFRLSCYARCWKGIFEPPKYCNCMSHWFVYTRIFKRLSMNYTYIYIYA